MPLDTILRKMIGDIFQKKQETPETLLAREFFTEVSKPHGQIDDKNIERLLGRLAGTRGEVLKIKIEGSGILHMAAWNGHEKAFRAIAEWQPYGGLAPCAVDLGESDDEGNTVAMAAARKGYAGIVEYLINRRGRANKSIVDFFHRNYIGDDAPSLAKNSGDERTIALIKTAMNDPDRWKETVERAARPSPVTW